VSWKNRNVRAERTFELRYEVTENQWVKSASVCLKVHKQRLPCPCRGKGQGKGKGSGKGGGKRKAVDAATAEQTLFAMVAKKAKAPMGDQFQVECPYYKTGTCVRVRTGAPPCTLGTHDPPDASLIECALAGVATTCRNGVRCMYKHSKGNGPKQAEAASSSGVTDEDLMDGVDSLL